VQIMLIPLKVDVMTWRTPWVNYAIMAVTVCVSILALFDMQLLKSLAGFGSDFLVHGGLLHLAGNMLFLWVFGNALNYKLGHALYLLFYLLAGLGASAVHYGFDGSPMVGASGAINGVMAGFLVFFPRNDVKMLWLPGIFYLHVFSCSSVWIILLWATWDVLYLVLGAGEGVALWAHVGGFVMGLAMATTLAVTQRIKPTPDEQTIFQVLGMRQ